MKRLILLLFVILTNPTLVNAQYTVDTSLTVNQYVEKLLGPGIAFSNAQLLGDRQAIGYFTDSSGQLGINSGLILSTGKAAVSDDTIVGFASEFINQGLVDIPELAAYVPNCSVYGNTYDGIILQFDFIPQNDSISLKFIYESEEYNDFVCSSTNDALAIIISGPGISGEQNIAVVPGTNDPITISTINNGSTGIYGSTINDQCILTNAQYFNSNPPTNIVYDGSTIVLVAKKAVIPCQTYTLRIMIADGCDSGYDSAVFLAAQSQPSQGPIIVSRLDLHTPSAYEDCTTLDLTFSKPDSVIGEYIFHYSISGSASNGIDYTFLPDSLIIPSGQDSTNLSLSIYQDNQTEGIETLIFTYPSFCGEIVSEFQLDDQPILELASSSVHAICSGQGPINLYVEVIQGIPPFTYAWLNNESTYSGISVSPVDTTLYRIYVSDQCGSADSVEFVVNTFPQPDPIILHFDTLTSTLSFDVPEGMYIGYWVIDSLFQQVIQPQLTLTEAGSYAVYIDYTNGCYLFSDTIQFIPSGFEVLEQIPFKLYPNPVNDQISIKLKEEGMLEIYDLAGRLIRIQHLQQGMQTISVTEIPQGMYLLRIQSASGKGAAKIFITH